MSHKQGNPKTNGHTRGRARVPVLQTMFAAAISTFGPTMKRHAKHGLIVLVALVSCSISGHSSGQPWQFRGAMWGGSPHRNNVAFGKGMVTDWDYGAMDRKTGIWLPEGSRNILWTSPIGSQSYSTPVVARERVFVGSNNGHGYLPRFPSAVDLGCMLSFRESTGEFLWQYSSQKLASGRVNDWPLQGIPSTPCVEADRMWFVDNRGRVVCLDTDGFEDHEDDGPTKGVWGVLFTSKLDLVDSLTGWQVPYVLVSSLDDLDSKVVSDRLRRDGEGVWTISRRFGREWAKMYRVVPSAKYIDVFQGNTVLVESGEPERPFRRINRFPFAGLENGKISPTLGQLLIRQKVRVSGRSPLMPTADRNTWLVEYVADGVKRLCRLKIANGSLEVAVAVADLKREADVVWRYDMMKELGVFQHNLATCSPAVWGDVVFVCTSNGVDEAHQEMPSPRSPSFIALDKRTGELLWHDNSPGDRVMHGQWASPAIGVFDGVPQVIFPGGDGWVYSFRADKWNPETKKPILLWKFDGNLKDAKWVLGGRGTRNNIISFPVIHEGRVYITMGQDPEHGEGQGRLWCIDPTRRGDVSAQLLTDVEKNPPGRREVFAGMPAERIVDNPNSAVLWKYDKVGKDLNQQFHRTLASPVISNKVLVVPDISGFIHCLDATTGKVHWTADVFAACWASGLIVDDKVYVGTEDGEVVIFPLTADPKLAIKRDRLANGDFATHGEPLHSVVLNSSIYSTPSTSKNVFFIATRQRLYAIGKQEK